MSQRQKYAEIEELVLEYFGVSAEVFSSRTRGKREVAARRMVAELSRKRAKIAYPKLSSLMSRNHSSVITSRNALAELVKKKAKMDIGHESDGLTWLEVYFVLEAEYERRTGDTDK
jgi:chromosomal replication initiation ATPase DnaA